MDEQLGRLGVEIWRLGIRLQAGNLQRLQDSHDRLLEAFGALGGRIDDRVGDAFVDGTTAEVIDQPDGVDPASGSLIWSETVRPGVYLHDRQVVIPQILLAVKEKE